MGSWVRYPKYWLLKGDPGELKNFLWISCPQRAKILMYIYIIPINLIYGRKYYLLFSFMQPTCNKGK